MPTPTPELGLLKAVDGDDTADYLVTSLANSLTSVDALFNNVSGHTHSGVHQGAPVTAAGVADGSLTNAKLGPDVARDNLLTNGGFEIWLRGAGPYSSNGAYSADRWIVFFQGTTTISASRDSANVVPGTGGYCAACTVTNASAGQIAQLYQYLASSDVVLNGLTVSFSARVKSSVANAVRLRLNDGAVVNGAYHSGSGNYETLSVTKTLNISSGQVQCGVVFEGAGTFYVDNASLVVGSQPANYVPLHPADDLARCQRYFQTLLYSTGSQNDRYLGQAYSGTNAQIPIALHPPMAVTPTITISAPSDFQQTLASASAAPLTGLSPTLGSPLSVLLTSTVGSGLVAGNATILYAAAAGAKLYGEANP